MFPEMSCVLLGGMIIDKVAGNGQNQGKSYGMELPRVGAFTDFRGSGYRNPVQN